jgi:hypothetical protein
MHNTTIYIVIVQLLIVVQHFPLEDNALLLYRNVDGGGNVLFEFLHSDVIVIQFKCMILRIKGPNIYIGAISTSNDDLNGVAQNLVESLISQFGAGNVSASHTGNSLNVNINVQDPNQEVTEVQRRLGTARRFISHAEHLLQHIIQPQSSSDSDSENATSSGATAGAPHSCPHHEQSSSSSESTQDDNDSSNIDEEMSIDEE